MNEKQPSWVISLLYPEKDRYDKYKSLFEELKPRKLDEQYIQPRQQCSKCSLILEPVMGYVCNNYPCPAGLGGVHCNVGG